jgi:cation transport protein ChaC
MLLPARPVLRDPAPLLDEALRTWGGRQDLWVFAYASLIWRPDFEVSEQHLARVHGWHRALAMWSRVNRGTPERPGLVFALLRGGMCRGMVLRVPRAQGEAVLHQLWDREMPSGVYQPQWLRCHLDNPHTTQTVQALAFTLPQGSPSHTGMLSAAQYRQIFSDTVGGRYGHTLDYARQTLESLRGLGIRDRALEKLLAHAPEDCTGH